jgi:hypothetical protein
MNHSGMGEFDQTIILHQTINPVGACIPRPQTNAKNDKQISGIKIPSNHLKFTSTQFVSQEGLFVLIFIKILGFDNVR